MATGINGSGNARTPIPTPRTGSVKSLEAPHEIETNPNPVEARRPEQIQPLAPTPASPEVVAETRGRVAASGEVLRRNLEMAQQRFSTDAQKFVSTVTSAVADGRITGQERADVTKGAQTVNLDARQVELAQARVQLDDLKNSQGGATQSRMQRMELRAAQTRVTSLENVVRAMGGDPSVQAPQGAPGDATVNRTALPNIGTPSQTVVPHGEHPDRADFANDMSDKKWGAARPPRSPDRMGALK